DCVGELETHAYGVLTVGRQRDGLLFDFHKIHLPLSHFHYDRFDTPDDEEDGKWSVNFATNPQGEIDRALVSLDEAEASFVRRVPAALTALETLRTYAGTYETPTGPMSGVVPKGGGPLGPLFRAGPFRPLGPGRPRRFRTREFSDVVFEFVLADGRVTELRQSDPSGQYRFVRR